MSDGAQDPSRCPLCGTENRCGMAAGSSECWCMSATVSKDAIERVPPVALGKACVCARCAAGASTGTPEAEPSVSS